MGRHLIGFDDVYGKLKSTGSLSIEVESGDGLTLDELEDGIPISTPGMIHSHSSLI